jgi:methionyl-tRNA formyltransferase
MLDWTKPAEINARMVRAYNPVPGAWFELGNERVKCWGANAIESKQRIPGTVIAATADGIDIACKSGALRMTELQRAGRRHVSAAEFSSQLKLAGKCLR